MLWGPILSHLINAHNERKITSMPNVIRRYALMLLFALLLGIPLSACSASNPFSSQNGVARFVGPVQNTTALIGFAVDQQAGKIAAYVCDSKNIGEWFTGKLNADGSFDLTNDSPAHLTGKLTANQVQGSFSQAGGQPLSYNAQLASDKQGIYRVNQTI